MTNVATMKVNTMLAEALQRIMDSQLDDKAKRELVNSLLSSKLELDPDDCDKIFRIAVGWVLQSDEASLGWLMIEHLERLQKAVLLGLIAPVLVLDLLRLDPSEGNIGEVPRFIAWVLRIRQSTDMETAVAENITEFVESKVKGRIVILTDVTELLMKYPQCIPKGWKRERLCEAIVGSIAQIPTSVATPSKIREVKEKMTKVEQLLLKLWECENSREIVFSSLKVIHNELIRTDQNPHPILASVIQLVEPSLIPQAVKALLRSDTGHSCVLRHLCEWLVWAWATRLPCWIQAFIDGLESEQKFDILTEVAIEVSEKLFFGLQLPAVRSSMEPVFWRIMICMRHNPAVFHKICNSVPKVVTHLLQEDSEGSKETVQKIVNMCCYMISTFPGCESFSDPVTETLKMCSRFMPPGEFAPEQAKRWKLETMFELTEEFKVPERSPGGRVGLDNLGNTCYMNSVLQALFMTQKFCSLVLESETQSQPLLTELQALFALLLHSKRRSIAPTPLLSIARPPGFQPGHQQDSSEFLTYLLDVLHEQEKQVLAPHVHNSPSSSAVGAGDEGAEADVGPEDESGNVAMTRWITEEDLSSKNILHRKARSLADFTQGDDGHDLTDSHSNSTDSGIQSVCGDEGNAATNMDLAPATPVYETLVQKCFEGRVQTSYGCLSCRVLSSNIDHFLDIQLAFPPQKPSDELSVQDMLDYYISPEHLSGENQYRCDHCVALHDALRSIQLLQLPSHLILTLKRFQFDSKTRQRTKLLHRVRCSEAIEINNQHYRLYAAVVHRGSSVDSGHYYTVARDDTLSWSLFNDSCVNACSDGPPPMGPPDTPYILFYSLRDEPIKPMPGSALPPLKPHLAELVERNDQEWLKGEEERHAQRRKYFSRFYNSRGRDKEDEGGGNPPGNCGGGMNLPTTRFIC